MAPHFVSLDDTNDNDSNSNALAMTTTSELELAAFDDILALLEPSSPMHDGDNVLLLAGFALDMPALLDDPFANSADDNTNNAKATAARDVSASPHKRMRLAGDTPATDAVTAISTTSSDSSHTSKATTTTTAAAPPTARTTPQTKTKKVYVRRDPRKEIAALHSEATQLQERLVLLQRRAATSRLVLRPVSHVTGPYSHTASLATGDAERSVWIERALAAFEQRECAEQTNKTLRVALERHVRLRRALETLLCGSNGSTEEQQPQQQVSAVSCSVVCCV